MRERGFTLIEMAVVLAIVGLIVGGLLGAFGALRTNQSIATSVRNHDAIATALREFLVRNNRLPCPAVSTLGPTDANYGIEAAPGAASACDGTVILLGPTERYYAGVVPWVTLGLQGDQRFDGNSRQYAYAVLDSDFVLNGAPGLVPTFLDGEPWVATEFTVVDAAGGNDITPREGPTLGPVVAVVSYGPNGSGGFNTDGGQLPMPVATALDELENHDGDLTVAAAQYSDDDVTPYDDVVRVYTEAQLITPLVESGALQPRDVVTRERLTRIENALVGFAMAQNVDPDGPPTGVYGVGCNCSLPTQPLNPPPVTCVPLPPPAPAPPVECNACNDPPNNGCARTVNRSLPQAGAAPNFVPTVALGLTAGVDDLDAWGNPIVYTLGGAQLSLIVFPPLNQDAGLYGASTLSPGPAFTLQSFGPDGFNDGCGPPVVNDDICTIRTIPDLVGQISAAGTRVD